MVLGTNNRKKGRELFEVLEYHRTFGQLGDTVKSTLSHRARGVGLLLPQLRQLIRQVTWPTQR